MREIENKENDRQETKYLLLDKSYLYNISSQEIQNFIKRQEISGYEPISNNLEAKKVQIGEVVMVDKKFYGVVRDTFSNSAGKLYPEFKGKSVIHFEIYTNNLDIPHLTKVVFPRVERIKI